MVDVSNFSNVFLLGRGPKANADYPAIAQVEAYWQAIYALGALPRRSEIDPRGLDQALSCTFMLECIAPRVARFRLAGAHLADLMGLELRGMPLTALFLPAARAQIGKLVETTCARPAVSELALEAKGGFGHQKLAAKMLLTPVTDDDGKATRMLGCLQSHGKIGRQPRRFTIKHVNTRALCVDDLPALNKTGAPRPVAPEFAEPAAPFIDQWQKPKPASPLRALKLVVDNS